MASNDKPSMNWSALDFAERVAQIQNSTASLHSKVLFAGEIRGRKGQLSHDLHRGTKAEKFTRYLIGSPVEKVQNGQRIPAEDGNFERGLWQI